MMDRPDDQDLIDLIAALKGGEVDPARREPLLDRLRRDEAFQEAFVDEIRMLGMLKAVQSTEPRWLRLHDELGWGSGHRGADGGHEDEFMDRIRGVLPRRKLGLRPRWPLAAAAVFVVGLAAALWPRGGPEVPNTDGRPAPVAVAPPPPGGTSATVLAVVLKLEGARWELEEGPPPVEGGIVMARRLRLRSGFATLAFLSGVTLTLEGPADVDLVSMDRVFCRRGKLRARVPRGAEGFVVASPNSAVVDLGTEFALNVEDGGKSQVMVFEGMAEAALLDEEGSSRRTQLVGRSKSFDLDPRSGRIAEAGAEPGGFAPAPSLPIPALILDPSYAGAILRSRPRGYWRFETLADGAIPSEVPGGPPMRVNGPVAIDDAAGNGCAVFRAGAPEQFLSTDVPWELAREPGHAVELWFCSEGYGYASLVGLFPPRELNPPEQGSRFLHTLLLETTAYDRQSLHRPASLRLLHRWPLDVRVQENAYSSGVYIPRLWHHVVAQKRGDRMEVYLDGMPGRPLSLESDSPALPCNLVVGRRTPDTLDPKDSRSFVGRLDELAIYDHTLSAEEVRHHFRMADPGPAPNDPRAGRRSRGEPSPSRLDRAARPLAQICLNLKGGVPCGDADSR